MSRSINISMKSTESVESYTNVYCLYISGIFTILLGILLVVYVVNMLNYNEGIITDVCNITSVSYPIMGSTYNFYTCNCGRHCTSMTGLCNKIFKNGTLIENKYTDITYLQMTNKVCSYYANDECVTDFNTLSQIVKNNIINMENMLNTSIICYKKNDVYFIENETKSYWKNITIVTLCFSIFSSVTIVNLLIYVGTLFFPIHE